MDKASNQMFGEEVALEGPDYVALVIEWDGIADELENEITGRNAAAIPQPQAARQVGPTALLLGALGVLALVGWGIHRLRAA
jgi:hypothetical protein